MVQNSTSVDRRTKFKVVCSLGSTCARGTPNMQTITTLYMQNPINLESFSAVIYNNNIINKIVKYIQ